MSFLLMPVCSAVNNDVVRVGITDNKFQNVLKRETVIFGTSECNICDMASKKIVAKIPANTDISIQNVDSGLMVTVGNDSAILRDMVIICPQGLLGI